MKKYIYYDDELLKITKKNQEEVENIHLYLSYVKNKTNSIDYNNLLFLAHFFMNLPFKALDIINTQLNTNSKTLPLIGHFYRLESSRYLVPDKTYLNLLSLAIVEAERVYEDLDKFLTKDVYYAGQIFWKQYQLEQQLSFLQKADICFSHAEDVYCLPASYMRVLTLKALQYPKDTQKQIERIKNWEVSSIGGPTYLSGFGIFDLDPYQSDFLSPFIKYAHFYELQEALVIVNGKNYVLLPEFHKVWQFPRKADIRVLVKEWQLKELKDGILRNYTEAVGKTLNEARAKELLNEELPSINQTVNLSLEILFRKASEWKQLPTDNNNSLESHIATFIHDWKIPTTVIHRGKKIQARLIYEQIIAYFMFKGDIKPLSAFSLTYYTFYIEQRHKPKNKTLSLFFKDPSIEGIKDTVKIHVEEVTKTLIYTGLGFSFPSIYPLKFFIGFTTKVIMDNVFSFRANKKVELSSFDDYQKFKKNLDEKTIELIKSYKPVNDLEQQALDTINGWYSYIQN